MVVETAIEVKVRMSNYTPLFDNVKLLMHALYKYNTLPLPHKL